MVEGEGLRDMVSGERREREGETATATGAMCGGRASVLVFRQRRVGTGDGM